jgi:ADP-heptose:LPS heptosyltransferase
MIKNFEIMLRRFFLKLLLLLSRRRTSKNAPAVTDKSKVLFIRLNRIGDALVTTPLLQQIKIHVGCSIHVLADRKNNFVFEHCPDVDHTQIFEKGLKGITKINSYITENNIDTIVDLHDDVSASVSLILSSLKAKQVFGLKKENEKLYTHTVERPDSSAHHIIERTLQLTKLFGFSPDIQHAEIDYSIDKTSDYIAESFMCQFTNKFKLGINITAGSTARFWGVDNFQKLILLLKDYDITSILFTSEDYLTAAKQITEEKNIYPPSKDFDIFAAGISKLNMLFTPDTSVVHICSKFKIPVFGLYVKYKTDAAIWSPYNTDFDAIITEEPTLKNITFEEVKNRFIPFLEKYINAK